MDKATNPELDGKVIEQPQPTDVPHVQLDVSVEEVNILLTALQELPYRISNALIQKIVAQGQAQLDQGGGLPN